MGKWWLGGMLVGFQIASGCVGSDGSPSGVESEAGAGGEHVTMPGSSAGAPADGGARSDGGAPAGAPAEGGSPGSSQGGSAPVSSGGEGGIASGGAGEAGQGGASPILPAVCQDPPAMPALLEGVTCPVGCREIVAYPIDPDRLCADSDAGELISCSCGVVQWQGDHAEACLKDETGRRWLVARGNELGLESHIDGTQADPLATYDTSRFSPCTSADYWEITQYPSCDFAHCAEGPDSPCSAEMTAVGSVLAQCAYPNVDISYDPRLPAMGADGCKKPACTTDDDCGPDARCAFGDWSMPYCSFDYSGSCRCSGGIVRPAETGVCIETELSGPRGAWQSYEIEDYARHWKRRVTATGSVEHTYYGKVVAETQLSQTQLRELDALLNSYWLRNGLQNGFLCSTRLEQEDDRVPPVRHGSAKLVVGDQELFQELPRCMEDHPGGGLLDY